MTTRSLLLPLLLCLTILCVTAYSAAYPVPVSGTAGCITWTTEARYEGLGYNHYVHFQSACKEVMACEATTNVNPKPTGATVQPGGKATVITFRGSPASAFTARVTCTKK